MLMAGQKMTIDFSKYIKAGRELFSSLFFPLRCPVCDEILEPEETKKGIHSACESKLYLIRGAVCMHCGRPLGDSYPEDYVKEYCYDCLRKKYDKQSYVKQAKSLFVYKGAVKQSMYRFKYANKREYAAFFADQALAEHGAWLQYMGLDAIVPVSLYPKKKRKRGYNQAEVFARELSARTGVPVETDLVQRVIDTVPQKGLGDLQRKNNLKNAFFCGQTVVQYKCVLVVDDI